MKVRPPTYFNRKVGDRFTYRGVVHRVVAIHQLKDNRLAGASSTVGDRQGWGAFANPAPHHQMTGGCLKWQRRAEKLV